MKIRVTSDDVSLFHLAVQHYGNALEWWRIAERNGGLDPDLTLFDAPVQLDIPEPGQRGDGSGLPAS
ncbi:hypothetical protein AA0535_1503 [Asaia krungthepensis NRIC 0535]|uniref:LysM domain-containing protein n=1 Tax=Asaia krungthepensis NRIC 0535 TaxID=1307925 RepID=A0ABQ0Q2L3_9PROT|nr:hypothetical protein AA0535_1503 [Asaia krungthepensis NRIC 0535]